MNSWNGEREGAAAVVVTDVNGGDGAAVGDGVGAETEDSEGGVKAGIVVVHCPLVLLLTGKGSFTCGGRNFVLRFWKGALEAMQDQKLGSTIMQLDDEAVGAAPVWVSVLCDFVQKPEPPKHFVHQL